MRAALLACAFALAAAAAFATGCNNDTSDLCSPGQHQSCNGNGGCAGWQSCTSGGTFGACECLKIVKTATPEAGAGDDAPAEAEASTEGG